MAARAAEATAPAPAAVDALLPLLADSHAHPQLDLDHLPRTASLRVPCVAAMGVAANVDWAGVEQLASLSGPCKVIPGFGIHPWWSHLHASTVGSTWEELLEGPSPEAVQQAVDLLKKERTARHGVCCGEDGASDAAGARYTQQREAEGSAGLSTQRAQDVSTGSSLSSDSSSGSELGACSSPGDQGGVLDIVPHDVWRTRLRTLLNSHPHALVGEVGIDRSAVIPGSKARVRFDHQMALLREQMQVAVELRRPVSVHCVRGYGHLLQLFVELGKAGQCPPAVMLHSYGGSPEDVSRFCRIPGIGGRFFFSFSAAINARTPEKLAARIKAVPDERLLIESDQVTPLLIERGMANICQIVADAKGWGLEEAARRTLDNFNAFYHQEQV